MTNEFKALPVLLAKDMTLREWYIGQALSNSNITRNNNLLPGESYTEYAVKKAIEAADKIMEKRNE